VSDSRIGPVSYRKSKGSGFLVFAVTACVVALIAFLVGPESLAYAEEVTATVTPTVVGAAQPIEFTSPGGLANISVPVSAGESVSIVSGEAALSAGYRLDWLNPAHEYVRTWHPGGEDDRFFEAVRFEEAGIATLLLTPEEGATGSITLTLYDATDKLDSITPGPEGGEGTYSLDAPGQRDLISFTGTKGTRISIAPSAAEFEGEFHVDTPAGEWLEGSGGDLEGLHGPMTLPEGGTYKIVLTGDEAQTGSVGLSLVDLGQSGTAVPSRAGTMRRLRFIAAEEWAEFSVPVTAGESVSIVSSEAALSAGYRLDWLNPAHEYVRTWYPSGEADRLFEAVRFEESGEATLLVHPESGATGSIALTLFDASDAKSSMSLSPRGSMRSVAVAAPGQRDLVEFQGSLGDHVSVEPIGAEFEGEFHVDTPAGEWLEGSGGDLEGLHGPMTLPEGGTYKIVLTGDEAQTGRSSLCLKLETEGAPGGSCTEVALYPLDEGEGGVAHDAARFNDGTVTGASWVTGKYGAALKFDAEEEDEVIIPAATDLQLGSFTAETWVFPEEASSAAPVLTQKDGFALYAAAGSEETPRGEDGEGESVEAAEPLPLEQWSHLALTCGEEVLTLFVDGHAVDSTPSNCEKPAAAPVLVGAAAGGAYFDGRVDEIRVDARAETEAEVKVDSGSPLQAPAPQQAPEPIAAYAFEDGSGSTAGDLIGENDATLSGGPEWIEGADNGGALLFSATAEDSMEIPAIEALAGDGSFTLEATVQPRLGEGTPAPIFTVHATGGALLSLHAVSVSNAEEATWSLVGSAAHEGPLAEAAGPKAYASHEWENVALTYDGSDLRVYVNGELEAVGSAAELSPLEGSIFVGADPGAAAYFNGAIDDVRVYGEALSGAELVEDAKIPLENPRILIHGQAWEAEPEELVSPEESLSLAISDLDGRVERINLLVDGSVIHSWDRETLLELGAEETCTEEWCALTFDAGDIFPGSVSPGEHTLEVVATDSRGVSRRRSHTLTLDAHAPALAISGPLVEAEGEPLAEEAASLTAVAEDRAGASQSGLATIAVNVDGSEVESKAFSGAESGELAFEYRNADWGAGPRDVTIIATDAAGNKTIRAVRVNTSSGAVPPSCEAPAPEEVEAGVSADATEAEERLEAVMPAALEANSSVGTSPIDPGVGEEEEVASESGFKVGGSITGGRILATPSGGATIGQAACVVPSETTANATGPVAIPSASAVLYPNAGPEMDTLIRATALGSDIIDSLRGPSAPSTLTWSVATKEGQELVALANGGVAISAQEQQPVVTEESPEPLEGAGSPSLVNAVSHQATSALADVNAANAELGETVAGVIPAATAVGPEGVSTALELEISPWAKTVSATVPSGTTAVLLRLESAPDAGAMCAQAFESAPRLYESGCAPEVNEEAGSVVSEVEWSPTGKLYMATRPKGKREYLPGGGWIEEFTEPSIMRSNQDGSGLEEVLGPSFVEVESFDLSPSGERFVFAGCEVAPGGSCGIFVDTLANEAISLIAPLTGYAWESRPIFAANGKRIYFFLSEPDPDNPGSLMREVWSMKPDGTEKHRITDTFDIENADLSAGGSPERIVFRKGRNIWRVSASASDADQSQMVKLTEGHGASQAEFSPTGNFIVYSRTGGFESEAPPTFAAGPHMSPAFELWPYRAGLYRMNVDGSGQALLSPTSEGFDSIPANFSVSPNGGVVDFVSGGTVFETSANNLEYARSVTTGEEHSSFADLVAELTPVQGAEEEEVEATLQQIALKYPNVPGEPAHPYEGETSFCVEGYTHAIEECPAFIDDKAYATHEKYYLFHWKGDDDSTRSNAFLHSYWTALMVRDSHGSSGGKPDGLIFARLHEGPPPYNRESEMDFINDRVGTNYWLFDGQNSLGENQSKLEACDGLLIKAKNAIYLNPASVRHPGAWARSHAYRFRRAVYYRRYSYEVNALKEKINNIVVVPTGLTCHQASEKPAVPNEEGGYP
jgi:Concanavalin A-like lectin/glucanases superfamily